MEMTYEQKMEKSRLALHLAICVALGHLTDPEARAIMASWVQANGGRQGVRRNHGAAVDALEAEAVAA